jgi:hypothetical protein
MPLRCGQIRRAGALRDFRIVRHDFKYSLYSYLGVEATAGAAARFC